MDRKKFLGRGVVVLLLVGMGFAMVPFFGSWNPNARAEAARPRLILPEMAPGMHIFLPHPHDVDSAGMRTSVLVYRLKDGGYKIWQLPTWEGMVVLPDNLWWRWGGVCKNFGPTLVRGVVDESQPIRCHDKDLSVGWGDKYWQWDITGRNLGPTDAPIFMEDMEDFGGIVEGKDFVINNKRK